jgi:hypothetical protein
MTQGCSETDKAISLTRIRIICLAFLMLAMSLFSLRGWTQGAVGTIVGTVVDSSGAVLPGARVTVTNVGTTVAVQTKTTSAGDFAVPYLKPANYAVTVEASGFEKAEVSSITLVVGQTARVDVVLKPGAASQTVSVSASAVALDTDSSAIGQVITEKQIVDLPLQDRNFTNLLLLSPGAITTVTNGGLSTVMAGEVVDVSGARAASNGYLIDGMTNTEPFYTNTVVRLSLDAIQEFKEQSSTYSAQYGASAAQINISTKSGTNGLHGTLFEFNRNNAFDALSAFTPPNSEVPPLRQNDYGYSLGGPVYLPKLYDGRNRTFFFANFERLKNTTSGVIYSIAPTSSLLQGVIASSTPILDPATGLPFAQDASGNYIIPQSRWARLALVSTKVPGDYFPVAGSSGVNGTNSSTITKNPAFQNQQTYRIDQRIGPEDNLSARFTLANNVSSQQGIDLYASQFESISAQTWNVIETHAFNAHLVNQARVGWFNYDWAETGNPAPSGDVGALGLQSTYPPSSAAFPQIQFSNGTFSNAGGFFGVPASWGSKIWNGEDSISWIHGKHNLTLGFLAYINNGKENGVDNVLGEYAFDGSFTAPKGVTPTAGNTWADFLLGDIVSGQASLPTPYGLAHPNPPPWFLDQNKFAGYVNDDWKVSPRLTLNLGLRYDFQSNPNVEQAIWPVLTVPGGVICTDDRNVIASGVGGTLYKYCQRSTPKTPFAPRVGFSLRPFSSDKTVVRGGFGVFFDQYSLYEWDSAVNYPWVETFNPAGLNFNNLFPPLPNTVTASDVAGLYNVQPPYAKNPYLQEWSLGAQQELTTNTKLDVTYVGSVGRHLETRLSSNQPYAYNPNDTPAERAAEYPFYNFGTYGLNGSTFSPGFVLQGGYVGASNYNALEVSVNHREKDLLLLASFTWASSMDDTSSSGGAGLDNDGWQGPMDAHNIQLDYSKSSYDVNKRFVTSFVYELPFGRGKRFASGIGRVADEAIGGWQVNGIYSAQGGIPFNTSATDLGFVLGAYGQRSNLVGNPYPAGFKKGANEWFNTAAYAQPSIGLFGTESRNDLRAAGVDNLDFSLFKNFSITERARLQIRGEAFNSLNHTQLAAPNTSVSSSTFGVISGVQIPGRIVQLGGKVIF